MKGLVLSIAMLVGYVLATIGLAHLFKPRRHTAIFFPLLLAFTPLYAAAYWAAPPDLWFLAKSWQASPAWLDAAVGYVVFVLNVHSFIDYFFGFNGGFSTSIMLMLHRTSSAGLTTPEIVRGYLTPDGTDKIMGWRLPKLQNDGYVAVDSATGRCTLTPKGILIARLAGFFKRLLHLGSGG